MATSAEIEREGLSQDAQRALTNLEQMTRDLARRAASAPTPETDTGYYARFAEHGEDSAEAMAHERWEADYSLRIREAYNNLHEALYLELPDQGALLRHLYHQIFKPCFIDRVHGH